MHKTLICAFETTFQRNPRDQGILWQLEKFYHKQQHLLQFLKSVNLVLIPISKSVLSAFCEEPVNYHWPTAREGKHEIFRFR
jgi:hypothetical protein